MIDIRDNPAKSVLFQLPRGGARLAMVAILALTMLAPFLQGFALALQAGNPACGMACCKTAKAACHRSGHEGDHQFPRWTAGAECPSGCGQEVSLTGPVCAGLTANVSLAGPTLCASYAPYLPQSEDVRFGAGFALFERPPPFFG